MRVAIYKKDQRGCVEYNPHTREVEVHHEDKEIRKKVYQFLTKKQSFKLGGGSGEIGDYKVIDKVPSESTSFIELALCMLYQNTGVHVDWSDESNGSHNTLEPVVAKSLDGNEYEIL